MSKTRILPLFGSTLEPSEYYSKTEVDALIADFITKSVNDLTNYYLKSETYTQTEVNNLIGAIQQFHYEIYSSLSDITTPASNVLYLIGESGTGEDKYEEYVYSNNNFVKIGETSIDLSGYVTITALNTALAGKQDTLTAGSNITITNNVISATGGGNEKLDLSTMSQTDLVDLYSNYATIMATKDLYYGIYPITSVSTVESNGVTLVVFEYNMVGEQTGSNGYPKMTIGAQALTPLGTFVDASSSVEFPSISQMNTALAAKQDTLTAGNGITISSNTISGVGNNTVRVTLTFDDNTTAVYDVVVEE